MPVWSYSTFDFMHQRLTIRQLTCADSSLLRSGLSLISLWANVGGKVRHSLCPYKSVVQQRRTGFRNDDKFLDANILTVLTECATVCCRKSHCWQQCSWNCDAITLLPVAAWYTAEHEGKVFDLLAMKASEGRRYSSTALHGVNGQLHLEIRSLVGSSCGMDVIGEEKQSCSCWKLRNISTVLRVLVTIPTMLYRSSCDHNTV